jgi:hypothetical protein
MCWNGPAYNLSVWAKWKVMNPTTDGEYSYAYTRTNPTSGFTIIISTISSNLYNPIWTMTTCFGYNFP